ncbi:hypothetical protein AQUCO_01400373v1 [Aquilegia coerulea]|uniref:Uncharacterized protein n=1 Tax=Aquilegia coerulea TaxID=218851 RepID=A0A2G5DWB4_AQUCA|nr:hypothetical protein AQUCO_01400373v1 [Aquilegia coerulea]
MIQLLPGSLLLLILYLLVVVKFLGQIMHQMQVFFLYHLITPLELTSIALVLFLLVQFEGCKMLLVLDAMIRIQTMFVILLPGLLVIVHVRRFTQLLMVDHLMQLV